MSWDIGWKGIHVLDFKVGATAHNDKLQIRHRFYMLWFLVHILAYILHSEIGLYMIHYHRKLTACFFKRTLQTYWSVRDSAKRGQVCIICRKENVHKTGAHFNKEGMNKTWLQNEVEGKFYFWKKITKLWKISSIFSVFDCGTCYFFCY